MKRRYNEAITGIFSADFRGTDTGLEKAYIRRIPLKGIELKEYLN